MQSNSTWLWNFEALSSQILVGKLLLPWRIWVRSSIWPIKKKKNPSIIGFNSIIVSFCKEVKRVWGKYFSFHDDGVETLIIQLNNSSFFLFYKSENWYPIKSLFSSPVYICWKLGKETKVKIYVPVWLHFQVNFTPCILISSHFLREKVYAPLSRGLPFCL